MLVYWRLDCNTIGITENDIYILNIYCWCVPLSGSHWQYFLVIPIMAMAPVFLFATLMMKFRNCSCSQNQNGRFGVTVSVFSGSNCIAKTAVNLELLDISQPGELCKALESLNNFWPARGYTRKHQHTVLEKGHIPIADVFPKMQGLCLPLPKRLSDYTKRLPAAWIMADHLIFYLNGINRKWIHTSDTPLTAVPLGMDLASQNLGEFKSTTKPLNNHIKQNLHIKTFSKYLKIWDQKIQPLKLEVSSQNPQGKKQQNPSITSRRGNPHGCESSCRVANKTTWAWRFNNLAATAVARQWLDWRPGNKCLKTSYVLMTCWQLAFFCESIDLWFVEIYIYI